MKFRLSYESLFQAAFAISPFPFYLPQYFSMMQQLSSSDSNDVCCSPDSLAAAAIDRGGDHLNLRKRNHLEAGIDIASPPPSAGLDWTLYGTPSKSFEDEKTQPKAKELDAGLSRATVLLLLSAHLLRLLYFHGVILLFEERRTEAVEPGVLVSTTATAASATYSHTESSNLQWDLLGQSISMIAMQLLLLHTMMLIRRKQLKRQMKRMCDGEIAGQHSSDSSSHFHTITVPPMSGSYTATSLESSNHGCKNRNTSPSNSASQHIVPYWQAKRQQCYRATTDHLHQLLSPHNILQSHSFLEYCELLMLVSITVKLVFDYHWFPRYGIHVVDGLKHMSIVLESCLALPQAIRNHRKGTTEGLSVSGVLEDSKAVGKLLTVFCISYLLNFSSHQITRTT